jgi:hypothetical protein
MAPDLSRPATWRRLLRSHAEEFLEWAESTGKRFALFDRLAGALETFLLRRLDCGVESSAICQQFVDAIPRVLSHCDEPIYDEPFVAEAYAFVHLLERYRRFAQALDWLLRAGIIPMRKIGTDVIEVGAGAGSALYATADFYELLTYYSEFKGLAALKIPLPKLHPVEVSDSMVYVMHWISELAEREGPFQRKVGDFAGLDFHRRRAEDRDAIIRAIGSDAFVTDISDRLFDWQDQWRYNLGIFSYFLTQECSIERFRAELVHLFQSMRAGGVVLVMGATVQHECVFKAVERLAKSELVQSFYPATLPIILGYSDRYAGRIKMVYRTVWKHLASHIDHRNFVRATSDLPRDLWDPDEPLRGPESFSIQAFRRVNLRPNKHSWHKRKHRQ